MAVGEGQAVPELDLVALQAFYQVARLGSFSRAAEALHRSQPAVSRQVQALEATLGCPLLAGRRPRVVVNEAGRALLAYAERILRLCGEAVQTVDELRSLERGCVHLAASTTPGGYILPAMLARFAARHPGIEVHLAVAPSAEVARRVAAGAADVGVLSEGMAGKDFFVQALLADELLLVAPPGHPLATPAPADPARLLTETLLLREEGSGTRHAVEAHLARHGLHFARQLTLGCSEGIRRAVAAGMGCAFLSRCVVQGDVGRGALAVVPVPPVRRLFHLAVARETRISPAAAALRAFVQQAASLPPPSCG
jgi:DNA-binding transcriptional LysR family regulator